MSEINLLPWRQARRVQAKRQFIAGFCSLNLLALAYLALSSYQMQAQIGRQQARHQQLRAEITLLNREQGEIRKLQAEKALLIKERGFVQNLQKEGSFLVQLFSDLSKLLPADAYLRQMEIKEHKVYLRGIAESNHSISALMQNIEQNEGMRSPILIEMKKVRPAESYEFRISFFLALNDGLSTHD